MNGMQRMEDRGMRIGKDEMKESDGY